MKSLKFKIHFTATALKHLKKIDVEYRKLIINKIEELGENPFEMHNVKKLVNFDISYRLRVGNYRVLFERYDYIKIIDIIDILHRKKTYKRRK